MLTREHMAAALDRYLMGTCTSQELAEWAEAIDQREDIGLERAGEDVLEQIIGNITLADAMGGEHGLTHLELASIRRSLQLP